MSQSKWLILSGSYGEGHEQAARAIRQSVERLYPDVGTQLVDYMEWTHPYIHQISRSLFLQGVKKFPSLYGYLYNATKNENLLSQLLKKSNRLGSSRLVELVREEQPTTVVSTFPLAAGAISALKQVGLVQARTATVITDYSHHNHWIYPHTDLYLVGSEEVKASLAARGIPSERIEATGIPIREEFGEAGDKRVLRERLQLDPELPTVLWMGGGYGLFGDAAGTVRELERLPFRIQLVIVCGRNRHVREKLAGALRPSKHAVRVEGFIDYVAALMGAADLLVTKPGGLSTSEALAMGLPMLLYNALPGQEEDNARFLVRSGVAAEAKLGQPLVERVERILADSATLHSMREQAKALEKKQAAHEVVHRLMRMEQEAEYRRGMGRLRPSW